MSVCLRDNVTILILLTRLLILRALVTARPGEDRGEVLVVIFPFDPGSTAASIIASTSASSNASPCVGGSFFMCSASTNPCPRVEGAKRARDGLLVVPRELAAARGRQIQHHVLETLVRDVPVAFAAPSGPTPRSSSTMARSCSCVGLRPSVRHNIEFPLVALAARLLGLKLDKRERSLRAKFQELMSSSSERAIVDPHARSRARSTLARLF